MNYEFSRPAMMRDEKYGGPFVVLLLVVFLRIIIMMMRMVKREKNGIAKYWYFKQKSSLATTNSKCDCGIAE